jgi:hypothetical protein
VSTTAATLLPLRIRSLSVRALLATALAGSALPAAAQLTTDQVPWERTVPEDVQVQAELARSRIQLGPVRILPVFNVRNLGYNNNIFGSAVDPVGDWTGTIGLGARFYLPIGSKTFLRLEGVPEYTWYAHSVSRRQWGGRAEAALLAFFNHVSVEVAGRFSEDPTAVLSSEIPGLVTRNRKGVLANVELDVTRRISVFGGVEIVRERVSGGAGVPEDLLDVSTYDRTDGAARAGLRYRISPEWNVSLAAEGTQSRFVITPELRDNRSLAPLFGLHYDNTRFFASLYAGYRIGRSLDGSSFPPFETPTGSAFLSYYLTQRIELRAFGSRRLVYGTSADDPYYLESRAGGGVSLRVLSRLTVRGSGSAGTNDYSLAGGPAGPNQGRVDNVETYGGGMIFEAGRGVAVTAEAVWTRTTSPSFGTDRTVFAVWTGLSFGMEYSR